MIVGILFLINEVEFSIYRFPLSDIKNVEKWPCSVKLRFNWLTSRWALNIVGDCWTSIGMTYPSTERDFTFDRECKTTRRVRRFFLQPSTSPRLRRFNRLSWLTSSLDRFTYFDSKTFFFILISLTSNT